MIFSPEKNGQYCADDFWVQFLAATKQLYEWFSQSVSLCMVCLLAEAPLGDNSL